MPSAEIIAIGTELVLGQIVDTNTSCIAKSLNNIGVDVYRASVVGDNPVRISCEIINCLKRADIVITTGGLGPTVDDPTREAVAQALGMKLVFRDELWEQIKNRFHSFGKPPTGNNKRQAYIPERAIAIENPVGTAPAFQVYEEGKLIICLPGVPLEMRYLLENRVIDIIKDKFRINGVILTRVVHTTGIGESNLDEIIADLEEKENPTIGLAAHPGQVDIRITAKAATIQAAETIIQPVCEDLESRLGEKIYGYDQTALPQAIKKLLEKKKVKIHLFLDQKFEEWHSLLGETLVFSEISSFKTQGEHKNQNFISVYNEEKGKEWIPLELVVDMQHRRFQMKLGDGKKVSERVVNFGNREKSFNPWLINIVLNFIWESIQSVEGEK